MSNSKFDTLWLVLDLLGDSGQLWLADTCGEKVKPVKREYYFSIIRSIHGWVSDTTNSLPMAYINPSGSSNWQPLIYEELDLARKGRNKYIENILEEDPLSWKKTLVLAVAKATSNERKKNIPLLILVGETKLTRALESTFTENGWECKAAIAPRSVGTGGYALLNPNAELFPGQQVFWVDNSLPPSRFCYEWTGSEFKVDKTDFDAMDYPEFNDLEVSFTQLELIGRVNYALFWKHHMKEILNIQLNQKQEQYERSSLLIEAMKRLTEQLKLQSIAPK